MGEIDHNGGDSSEELTEQEGEEETKEEIDPEEALRIKVSEMLPYERKAYYEALEEEKKKPPLPNVPDQEKFDKVYILPMFCKPGKHQYMIKYKDTDEMNQARLLNRIKK